MAKLTALPEQSIINMLAGTIDFYVFNACNGRGIPCARRWPHYDPSAYAGASVEARKPFGYTNTVLKSVPENLREAYREMADGTSLTWRDMLTRCYLNGDLV